MIVKICANKTIEDAKVCLDAGADMIGILVGQKHSSTDFVDKETAKEICDFVAKRCDTVLVTHIEDGEEIIQLTKFIGNSIIQLHSNIEESEVEKISKALPKIKLIRLIHVSNDRQVLTDFSKMSHADFFLLDSFNVSTKQIGGTGLKHDWNKSKDLINQLNKPTFLAGGLTPENVKRAIQTTHPAGVDVNSGCKVDGKKNAKLIFEFVKNAKKTQI